jgi:hypothetical protein
MAEWVHDGVHSSVVCVAPGSESWSMKDFYSEEAGLSPLGDRMCAEFEKQPPTGHIYAPTVTAMNAEWVDPYEMPLTIRLRGGQCVMRYQDKPADMVPFHRDMIAKRRRSMLMSGGGCGLGIATAKGHAGIVHISTNGLVDRKRVNSIELDADNPFENMRSSRRFESNVHAIVKRFERWHVRPEEIKLKTVFFVPPKALIYSPDEPGYEETNRKLILDLQTRFGKEVIDDEGHTSLAALTRRLAYDLGFAKNSVSNDCYLPAAGQFAHTRNPDEFLKKARNLAWGTVSHVS